jgi:glycosyltransferase involved in cell wall biosynthesis
MRMSRRSDKPGRGMRYKRDRRRGLPYVSPSRRLLLISTTSKIGGTERIVLSLAQGMRSAQVDVRTMLAEDEGVDATIDWFRRHGVSAEASPAVLTVYKPHTWRTSLDLRRLVHESGADAANVHYGGNHLSIKDVLAVRAAGVRRCVVSIHHTNRIEDPRQRIMTRLGAQLVSAVVVTTEVAKNILLDVGVPDRKIHVIAPSVERPAAIGSRADARARLGIAPDAFVIGTVARLTHEKGISDLIEGAARVPHASPGVELLIAGDGPARAELETIATSRMKGRVHFAGRVAVTGDIYAASDIFALPSHMEGFGLVYLEAALYQIPSIGTSIGGIPTAIQDGVTGILVPLRDIDSVAAAIAKLRDDPELRRRMGEAARQRAEKEFSSSRMCEKYERVLFPDR